MKQWVRLGVASLCYLGLTVAFAADTAVKPASIKIGVVDVRQVLQKIPQMEKMNQDLEKKFQPREAKIVDAQKVLKDEGDKLDRDGATMSDTDRTQLRDKIIAERANTQALITAFQQDLSTAQNQVMQKLLGQIAEVVNQIAKDDHYDLILQGENVPYVDSRLNMTDRVIGILGKKG